MNHEGPKPQTEQNPNMVETVARAAHLLGIKRVMVVHGTDGIDELSVSAPSRVVIVGEDGKLREQTISPAEFDVTGHVLADLNGGDAAENAAVAHEILAGSGSSAIRDAVMLNAGAALWVRASCPWASEAV